MSSYNLCHNDLFLVIISSWDQGTGLNSEVKEDQQGMPTETPLPLLSEQLTHFSYVVSLSTQLKKN